MLVSNKPRDVALYAALKTNLYYYDFNYITSKQGIKNTCMYDCYTKPYQQMYKKLHLPFNKINTALSHVQ